MHYTIKDIKRSKCLILSNFHLIVLGWASPLTYQVLGHIKSIVILVFGVFLYDSIPSFKSLFGMTLAMIGVIIYTEENRLQQKIRQSTQYSSVNVDKIEIENNDASKGHFNIRQDNQPLKSYTAPDSDTKC